MDDKIDILPETAKGDYAEGLQVWYHLFDKIFKEGEIKDMQTEGVEPSHP